MISVEAIEKIEELAIAGQNGRTEMIEKTYFHLNEKGATPLKFPMPKMIELFSLTQVVNYVKDVLVLDEQRLMINVSRHDVVDVLTSAIQENNDRHVHAQADFSNMFKTYQDGQYLSQEDFIIQLLSRFQESPSRDQLLKLVSSIKSGQSVETDDDGFSQKVEVKAGVALVKEQSLQNLWVLHPHKTFPEIAQPAVKYILRVRKGSDTPQLALFEADGGEWKVRATQAVRDWLVQRFKVELADKAELVSVL